MDLVDLIDKLHLNVCLEYLLLFTVFFLSIKSIQKYKLNK